MAQWHFIQALRLARAGGDVQLGCYVPTTTAMQSLMRGFASEAVDMAQSASSGPSAGPFPGNVTWWTRPAEGIACFMLQQAARKPSAPRRTRGTPRNH